MRISLTKKITFALVLFGLVPASIIAWFAYDSTNDFRLNQTLLIKQAAISISDKAASVLLRDPGTLKEAKAGTLSQGAKEEIRGSIGFVLTELALDNSQVFIFTHDGKVLVKRKPYGQSETDQAEGLSLTRYQKWAETNATMPVSAPSKPYAGEREGKVEMFPPFPTVGTALSRWSSCLRMSPSLPSTRTSSGSLSSWGQSLP
jgi:hypothetical protein